MNLRWGRPGFRRGFTLVEMMISVSICLGMMLVVTGVFKVCTGTVRSVERRLAVYEAARGILDTMDIELGRAYQNEKGEQFSIRNVVFDEASTSYKNQQGQGSSKSWDYNILSSVPYVTSGPIARYFQDMRLADSIHYVRWGAQPNEDNSNPASVYPRAYYFPIVPTGNTNTWGGGTGSAGFYAGATYSTLQVLPSYWNSTINSQVYTHRTDMMANPARIQICTQYAGRTGGSGPQYNTTNGYVSGCSAGNEPSNFGAPGHEIFAPRGPSGGTGLGSSSMLGFNDPTAPVGTLGFSNLTSVSVLDFGIAYWQDGVPTGSFVYPTNNTAIYFAPPPKAICVTIQVCDRNKQSRICLTRIVQIKTGNSPANANFAAGLATTAPADVYYYDPARYNRMKQLGPTESCVNSWIYADSPQPPTNNVPNDGFQTGEDN